MDYIAYDLREQAVSQELHQQSDSQEVCEQACESDVESEMCPGLTSETESEGESRFKRKRLPKHDTESEAESEILDRADYWKIIEDNPKSSTLPSKSKTLKLRKTLVSTETQFNDSDSPSTCNPTPIQISELLVKTSGKSVLKSKQKYASASFSNNKCLKVPIYSGSCSAFSSAPVL